MFTGIIEHTGELKRREGARLTIDANATLVRQLTKGASISIDGTCCTVIGKTAHGFSVELMPETIKRTTLGVMKRAGKVNLELPATPRTFLSGHIVQGHVDGIGVVRNVGRAGNSRMLTVSIPQTLSVYVIEKGSITLNGVSLTVIDTANDSLAVGVIPHTFSHTTLGDLRIGDRVNIEVDVLAKYMERLSKRV